MPLFSLLLEMDDHFLNDKMIDFFSTNTSKTERQNGGRKEGVMIPTELSKLSPERDFKGHLLLFNLKFPVDSWKSKLRSVSS